MIARAAHTEAKKQAPSWRQKYLKDLAEARARETGTDVKVEMRNLSHIEAQRQQARNVRNALHRYRKGLAMKLFIKNNGEKEECYTQPMLVQACIDENERRFTRVLHASTMIGQLLQDIGPRAERNAINNILQGTYNIPNGTDKYVRMLLEELQMPQAAQASVPMNTLLTTEVHIQSG